MEMRARAMRDGFSHFIKCEMRGERTGAAKSIGLALGGVAASHFFKKVRCGCVTEHGGRFSLEGSEEGGCEAWQENAN